MWDPVVLATDEDSKKISKRFLTRTARYSGLLNILNFATVDMGVSKELEEVLSGATTFLAFNVSRDSIGKMADAALASGVKKALFTLEMQPSQVNDTVVPEFDAAVASFEKAGATFTGIRHGVIIEGDENNAYEMFNASMPLLENTVERGVLARVAAELLNIDGADNIVTGLSSANEFAGAYLNILRSSGLTRKQEVQKVFEGGVQRVAQLTVAGYEDEERRKKDAAERKKQRIEEEKEEEAKLAEAQASASAGTASDLAVADGPRKRVDGDASITPFWDEDDDSEGKLTDAQRISERSEEILRQVYSEFEARLYAKTTSRTEFFESNRQMAIDLATEELAMEKAKTESDEEKQAKQLMVDRLVDVNRKQYSKLLGLERKEMENQKAISDTWVKYVYLLLETTMDRCEKEDQLFFNLDQFAQTMVLREVANDLRADQGLPAYDVVYDPLDAEIIVKKYSGSVVDLSASIETLMGALTDKYANTLKSVPALRSASQIVELAIETLQRELPDAPPTVNEKRAADSETKREAVSAARLDKITTRGKPTPDDDSVGRL